MNTKEKLQMLWQYLFLFVVAIGVFRFTDRSHSGRRHFGHGGDHDMLFIGDDNHAMDVKVEKEIVDGDTLVKMWINGEEVDAEEHDMKDGSFKWKSKDGNVMVIDVDDIHDGTHKKEKHRKVIKKKIVIKDEN